MGWDQVVGHKNINGSSQNATVVVRLIRYSSFSFGLTLNPVSSAPEGALHLWLIRGIQLSAGISRVKRFSAFLYWRTISIFPSSATGGTAAAAVMVDEIHFASWPLARTVSHTFSGYCPHISVPAQRTTGIPSFSTLRSIFLNLFLIFICPYCLNPISSSGSCHSRHPPPGSQNF